MRLRTLGMLGVAVLVAWSAGGLRPVAAAEKEESGKLLQALPKSKHTLADGIKQAAAKAPEVVISAKFELEEGKLSLSVYTAEKGLGTDAEHNVLKELAGSPEAAQWKPEAEVYKDVPHVSRASQQLTLMSLSKFSLLDILQKVEKDQPGTVFSITPVLRDRKAQFVVLVAAEGKVVEVRYDLMTGESAKSTR
jgi:hypothetical protein